MYDYSATTSCFSFLQFVGITLDMTTVQHLYFAGVFICHSWW